jgi:TP901 family phage tail tape measure protein
LGILLQVNDQASAGLARFGRNLNGLHGTTKDFAKGVSDVGAKLSAMGSSVLHESFALAKGAAPFVDALLGAAGATHASAAEFELLRLAAYDSSNMLKSFDATQSAKALTMLGKEGASARDAITELGPALTYAKLAGFGAEEGAKGFSRMLKQFGLGADQATTAINKFGLVTREMHVPADELAGALRKMALGGEMGGASFDDALMSIGLARQVLPDTAQAANAVGQAFRKLGDSKFQAALHAMKVEAKSANGDLRPLSAIVADLAAKTSGMTEAQRTASIAHLFGAKAAGGVMAMMEGMAKHSLPDLVAAMGTAKDASAALLDKQLNTWSGQQSAIKAIMSSIGVAIGEPFVQVFKPVAKMLIGFLLVLKDAIVAVPAPVKNFIASFVVGAGVLLSGAGASMALAVALAVMVPVIKAAAVGFVAFAIVAAPALVLVGALGAALYGLKLAYDRNAGGLKDFADGGIGKVSLAWKALQQLFTTGGFSGAVLLELDKAENQGVRNFAKGVYVAAMRIGHFFESIGKGFGAALDAAGPTFERLRGSLDGLLKALGFLGDAVDPNSARARWDAYGAAGESFGAKLGYALDLVVRALTFAIDFGTGFLSVVDEIGAAVSPASDSLGELWVTLQDIGAELGWINGTFGGSEGGLGAVFGRGFGRTLALAAGYVSDIVSAISGTLRGVGQVFLGVVDVVRGVVHGDWSTVMDGMKRILFGAFLAMTSATGAFGASIARTFDAMLKPLGIDLDLAGQFRSLNKGNEEAMRGLLGLPPPEGGLVAPGMSHGGDIIPGMSGFAPSAANMPAVAAAQAQAEGTGAGIADLSAAAAALRETASKPPTVMNHVQVVLPDGQVLAELVGRSQAASDFRGGGSGGAN